MIVTYLKAGHTFYDIGAHNGYFSLLGARLTETTGHVYSFEPFPANFEQLKKVLEVNQIVNCTPVNKAVSNVSGESVLWIGNDNTFRPSLLKKDGYQCVNIGTVTLNEFVKRNRQPNLIKVDVEGVEALVLEGATDLLSSEWPILWIIEIHDQENEKAVSKMLALHNYRFRTLMRAGPLHKSRQNILAWKQTGNPPTLTHN